MPPMPPAAGGCGYSLPITQTEVPRPWLQGTPEGCLSAPFSLGTQRSWGLHQAALCRPLVPPIFLPAIPPWALASPKLAHAFPQRKWQAGPF